jgi:hypothetical protein
MWKWLDKLHWHSLLAQCAGGLLELLPLQLAGPHGCRMFPTMFLQHNKILQRVQALCTVLERRFELELDQYSQSNSWEFGAIEEPNMPSSQCTSAKYFIPHLFLLLVPNFKTRNME